MIYVIRLLAVCYLCVSANAATWYAAPSALTSGNGSIANPWTLFAALMETNIVAGDTLNLRGGNYHGPGFISNLTGTSNNYITVRSYPGEWAVVTDGLVGVVGVDLPNSDTNISNIPITGLEQLSIPLVFFVDEEMFYVNGFTGTNYNLVRGWGATTVTNHVAGTRAMILAHFIRQTGSYVKFQDFEITALTYTTRTVGKSNFLGGGIYCAADGVGNKLINLIIHNVGQPGIGFFQQGGYGEINGCLIWGVGEYDWGEGFTGNARGSAIYAQNGTMAGVATVKNIISFRNWTSGGKVFGESGPVANFQFLSNIVFQCDPPLEGVSGSTSTSNIWWNGNVIMGTPILSYVSISNRAQYFINNLVVNGSFSTAEHADSVYTNNTVLLPANNGVGGYPFTPIQYQSLYYSSNSFNVVWDYNTYYFGTNSATYPFAFESVEGGTDYLWFQDWSDVSGFDTHSSSNSGWPVNYLNVSVQRLDYDTNRWHISVVGTGGQTNLALTLSDYGFVQGQRYRLVDAQNWPAVVTAGNYAGGTINLPLTLTNVSSIQGAVHFTNRHTNLSEPGLFNAFVLTSLGTTTINATTLNIGQ